MAFNKECFVLVPRMERIKGNFCHTFSDLEMKLNLFRADLITERQYVSVPISSHIKLVV